MTTSSDACAGWSEDLLRRIDPNLRIALNLAAIGNTYGLFFQTGLGRDPWAGIAPFAPDDESTMPRAVDLTLFVEMTNPADASRFQAMLKNLAVEHRLTVATAVLAELVERIDSGDKAALLFPASLRLESSEYGNVAAKFEFLLKSTRGEAGSGEPGITRLSLAGGMSADQFSSWAKSADMRPSAGERGAANAGPKRAVVGIIDDGCALARWKFIRRERGGISSRIAYLWDQSEAEDLGKGESEFWNVPVDLGYGREVSRAAIDEVLGRIWLKGSAYLDEDLVYETLQYESRSRSFFREAGIPRAEIASHGTCVMDIAACGPGGRGIPSDADGDRDHVKTGGGSAHDADIIFVQLPGNAIRSGSASVLAYHLAMGIRYVFSRARAMGVPAVVNVSYGGYAGPHDGTSDFERYVDDLLGDAYPNRSVVFAAQNTFERDCHAHRKMEADTKGEPLRWLIQPEDPTPSVLQLWYRVESVTGAGAESPALQVSLMSPEGREFKVGALGAMVRLMASDEEHAPVIGYALHLAGPAESRAYVAHFYLNATVADATDGSQFGRSTSGLPRFASSPAGQWTLIASTSAATGVDAHAWIELDDGGRPSTGRRLQSRFHADDADRAFTLSSYSTGLRTICVGAFNLATNQLAPYTASGPQWSRQPPRDNLAKPDVVAPAASDPAGRGMLAESSRSASPRRMNGTSAAAPYIAGLVAAALQDAHDRGQEISALDMRLKLRGAANGDGIRQDGRIEADSDRHAKHPRPAHPDEQLAGCGVVDAKAFRDSFKRSASSRSSR